MLTELRDRGLADALTVCCDGLRGPPESIRATWPQAAARTCVAHTARDSPRYASKKRRGPITKAMREICTAPTVEAAEASLEAFAQHRQDACPAMTRAWRNNRDEFTPFLEFPSELRRIVHTTNAVESPNARPRRAVRHRGHFPNEQAAMKILYPVATARHKNRTNPTGKTNGWKTTLNTLTIHHGDRTADHTK